MWQDLHHFHILHHFSCGLTNAGDQNPDGVSGLNFVKQARYEADFVRVRSAQKVRLDARVAQNILAFLF